MMPCSGIARTGNRSASRATTGTNSVRNAGPVFEREPGYNPERALWQSVLLLAIEEALNGVNGNGNIPQAKRELMIERTRAYLTRPSHDLALVCSGAEIDMNALIERMKGRIANAPDPAELAVGKRSGGKLLTN